MVFQSHEKKTRLCWCCQFGAGPMRPQWDSRIRAAELPGNRYFSATGQHMKTHLGQVETLRAEDKFPPKFQLSSPFIPYDVWHIPTVKLQ